MTERETLISIKVITDCDSDMYRIGEIDFSIPCSSDRYFSKYRKDIVKMLRFLADKCEVNECPFGKIGSYPADELI